MQKIKQLLSFLFNKETLIKIILIQIIVVLFSFMDRGGFVVYHEGKIDTTAHVYGDLGLGNIVSGYGFKIDVNKESQ